MNNLKNLQCTLTSLIPFQFNRVYFRPLPLLICTFLLWLWKSWFQISLIYLLTICITQLVCLYPDYQPCRSQSLPDFLCTCEHMDLDPDSLPSCSQGNRTPSPAPAFTTLIEDIWALLFSDHSFEFFLKKLS